jgi:hypothetical protein
MLKPPDTQLCAVLQYPITCKNYIRKTRDNYLHCSVKPCSTHAVTTFTRVVALLCRGKLNGIAVTKPEMVAATLIKNGTLIVRYVLVAGRRSNVLLDNVTGLNEIFCFV